MKVTLKMLSPIELAPEEVRQYMDVEATLRALRDTQKAALEVRGSMFWREMGAQRYLIRVASRGSQTSLGPYSEELDAVYTRFMERKAVVGQRLVSLKAALAQHQRSNRALRLGRAPRILIDTLNRLEQAGVGHHFLVVGTHAGVVACSRTSGVGHHFLVVGTHALYAYETACGVRVQDDAIATQQIDLLLDTRKYLSFVTTMDRLDTSLLAIFQKSG
jgi:Nucleotidyltransferase